MKTYNSFGAIYGGLYTTSKKQRCCLAQASANKKKRSEFWKKFKETHPPKNPVQTILGEGRH
jgi:hypothetical protein